MSRSLPDPGNGDDIMTTLAKGLEELPRQQRALGRAVLAGPEVFAFGSIRYVAARVGITTGTIMRFCRGLGYSGYSELQHEIRAAYLTRAGLQAEPAHWGDTEGDTLHTQHLMNLHRTSEARLAIDGVAIQLVDAKRVYVCGESVSASLAQLMVRMLRFAGLRAEFTPCSGVDRTIGLADLGRGDIVVGIGLWMEFTTTVETLKLARSRGATVVAVTASSRGPVARCADHVLVAPAQGHALSFSVVAIVAMLELVADRVAVVKRRAGQDAGEALHHRFAEEGVLAPLVATSLGEDRMGPMVSGGIQVLKEVVDER